MPVTPRKTLEQRREELRTERLMHESAMEKAKTEGRYWEAMGTMQRVRGRKTAFLIARNRAWLDAERKAFHSSHAEGLIGILGPVSFIGTRREAVSHFATILMVDDVIVWVMT